MTNQHDDDAVLSAALLELSDTERFLRDKARSDAERAAQLNAVREEGREVDASSTIG